jgi:hypothetical protein
MNDEQGFADRMNRMNKYVASRTLRDPAWNATVIQGDLAEAVGRLKQAPGDDILQYGWAITAWFDDERRESHTQRYADAELAAQDARRAEAKGWARAVSNDRQLAPR